MNADELQKHIFATYLNLRVGAAVIGIVFPLLLWVGELGFVRDRPPWLAVTVRWLLVVAACATAVVLALGFGAETAPGDEYSELYGATLGAR